MQIDTNMIIRIAVLVIALANQTLIAMGKNPIPYADETVYETISLLVTIGASAWAAWKNNNATDAAKTSQKVLDAIKAGTVKASAVEALLNREETK